MKHKANKDESWGEEPGMPHHIDMKPLMPHEHHPFHHGFGGHFGLHKFGMGSSLGSLNHRLEKL